MYLADAENKKNGFKKNNVSPSQNILAGAVLNCSLVQSSCVMNDMISFRICSGSRHLVL